MKEGRTKRGMANKTQNVQPSTAATTDKPGRLDAFKEQSKIILFCQRTSIRGLLKIVTSPTLFLKVLWVFFVICMTFLLFVTTVFLVLDYLNYNTAVTTRKLFDDPSEFPAITICSHNPFSLNGIKMWKSQEVVTPSKFQEFLRQLSISFIRSNDPDMAIFTLYDKIDIYYAMMPYEKTVRLGHSRDMIPYCMVNSGGFDILADKCNLENKTGLVVRHFSHAEFFNCWTIEYEPNNQTEEKSSTASVESLISIISLTPFAAIPELKDSFVMDTLTRGEGVKIVIHEPGTYPNFEADGINLQPGKMNRITYEPNHWKLHSTPNKKCRKGEPPKLRHLNNTYRYTQYHCWQSILQKNAMKQCGCMLPIWPRPQIPSVEMPYCLGLGDNLTLFKQSIRCYSEFMQQIKFIKEEALKIECEPLCDSFTYQTDLSVTKWIPSTAKLKRLQALYDSTSEFLSAAEDEEVAKKYIDYLSLNFSHDNNSPIPDISTMKNDGAPSQADNINDSSTENNFNLPNFNDESRFTYVSLARKSQDTILKEEKLVLDINILLSRIGGMCSLSIGLTMSFFIELIEFIYISVKAAQKSKSKSKVPAANATEIFAAATDDKTKQSTEMHSLMKPEKVNSSILCIENQHQPHSSSHEEILDETHSGEDNEAFKSFPPQPPETSAFSNRDDVYYQNPSAFVAVSLEPEKISSNSTHIGDFV